MWPIKEKENRQTAQVVAKSYPLQLVAGMYRYGSLININPSDKNEKLLEKTETQKESIGA